MNITIGGGGFDWVNSVITLVAVLIGGGIAWATTLHFERAKSHERDLGLAYGLLFKVLLYTDESVKLDLHIKDAVQAAKERGFEGPLWSRLPDILGFKQSPESISADELALVARSKNADLVMKILEVESGHSIVMQSFRAIQELRLKLHALNLDKTTDGRVVSYVGSGSLAAEAAPITASLDDLSDGLEGQVERIAKKAQDITAKLCEHLISYYKFKDFMRASVPDHAKTDETKG